MGFTNVYWQADKYSRAAQGEFPIDGHQGINWELPVQEPVTAGWYFGEGQIVPNTATKTYLNPQPEYFAVGGQLPTIGGRPMLDQQTMRFSREKNAKRV